MPGLANRTDVAELRRQKRRLRMRIGRLRRRLDGRVHAARREAARLLSWRTYVRRYPGHAFLAAMALGMSASAGLSGGRWARLLAMRLVRRVGDDAGRTLWAELARIWADSAPGPRPGSGGGGHA